MEPVTHILTGACLARTGLNRRAAYATATLAVAAELPDIDTLWSIRGPVENFTHHRGITHTFLGLPFEAALLVGVVYLLHRWRLRRHRISAKPLTAAPVRWGTLYGFALLGLLSHLLLDYTNNYGIRPFFPFDPRWYAASIVFIVDPLILLLLFTGLLAPALFGLIGAEVRMGAGARRHPFRGRGWAIAALTGVLCLWALRTVEHRRALDLTLSQTVPLPNPPSQSGTPDDTPPQYVQPLRAFASPSPLDPFHWTAVADLGPVYQLAEVDLRDRLWLPAQTPLPKPGRSPAILAAERSPLGRAYLDWSPTPILTVDDMGTVGETLVTLRDPRFMGGWLRDSGRSALTATVLVRTDGTTVWQSLDGRTEH